MIKPIETAAQQIAMAATAFQKERTGHEPAAVSVVISGDMLVVTLHGALSLAELAMALTPEGAATVQDFHRNLFHSASDTLRKEIKRITGVEVREATAQVEPTSGAIVQIFTSGTMVQVFLLTEKITSDAFHG